MVGPLSQARISTRLSALLVVLLSLALSQSTSSAETVQSLRYGASLYYFFQQDYYSALTELMTAEKLQELGPHKARGELLRGGMNLSYGMDKYALQTFEKLLDEEGSLQHPIDKDRAWFYLAKMAWQRGDTERSLAVLDRMSESSRGSIFDQANYLRSSIALQNGDQLGALSYAEKLPADSPWRYYPYYNLGAAQAAIGNWEEAVSAFARFDDMVFPSPESKAVHDKALTASGFALMASNKFSEAQAQFTRVRLESPMADRALLGYGWAASEMGNFGLALSSWQTLTGRELGSPSAREGLLAIPYAYEKLDLPGIALEHYRRAANAYLVQLSSIRVALSEFREGDLAQLMELGVGAPGAGSDARGWVFGEDILPQSSHSRLISQLLTRGRVQLALRELQDLYRIAWHLEDAKQRLMNLAQVDADQRASWESVTSGGRRDQLQQRQQSLEQRIEQLEKKLQKTTSGGGTGQRMVADVKQTQRWEKLDRAKEISQRLLADDPDTSDYVARLSLLNGLMLWRDSEEFAGRSWALRSQLQELKQLAGRSAEMLEQVDRAIAKREQAEFSQRIEAMDARLTPHAQRVTLAISQSERQLRELAVAQLEQQEQQVKRSLGQSRLAIARLYDHSSEEVLQ